VAESGEEESGHQKAFIAQLSSTVPRTGRGYKRPKARASALPRAEAKAASPRSCKSMDHGHIVQLSRDLASRKVMCWQRSGGLDRPEVG
jgi:hypothetical protein